MSSIFINKSLTHLINPVMFLLKNEKPATMAMYGNVKCPVMMIKSSPSHHPIHNEQENGRGMVILHFNHLPSPDSMLCMIPERSMMKHMIICNNNNCTIITSL